MSRSRARFITVPWSPDRIPAGQRPQSNNRAAACRIGWWPARGAISQIGSPNRLSRRKLRHAGSGLPANRWRLSLYRWRLRHPNTARARSAALSSGGLANRKFTALTTPPPDRILSAATSDAVISASKPFSEDNILRFPRGAYAGQCLHRLFEYADLSTPCDWPAAIERTLREYPELARRNDDDRLSAMMMAMLNDVAASELIPGLRLNAVESACQLSELEFILPVASLDLSALRALLGSYVYPEVTVTAETLAGYLCGAIDRVFQHAGRFWIIDWKSNDLGGTAACYAPAQLGAEIAAHAYHLQTLI